MKKKTENRAQIWAIGSGKGGTGKTLVISQIAKFLAGDGKRVLLIDCDLSAPNIHSFFGIPSAEKSILDCFEDNEAIENLIQPTRVKNLKIITGNQNGISFIAIGHKQIKAFFSGLERVNADYILLDLGGGSSQMTIDFFLKADKKIVTTDLEIISIENLLHFIRNTFFRKLHFSLNHYGLNKTIENLWNNRKQYQIKTLGDLIRQLGEASERIDQSTLKKVSHLQLYLIVNKVRKANDIIEGFSIKSICMKYFGVDIHYSGYVEYDNQSWKNFSLVPSHKFIISPRIEQEIITIAENIKTGNQIKIDRIKNV